MGAAGVLALVGATSTRVMFGNLSAKSLRIIGAVDPVIKNAASFLQMRPYLDV
jgi:hypothetical protein